MNCERCGSTTHRDDAMVRRCDGCERIVRLCICVASPLSLLGEGRWMDANGHIWHLPWRPSIPAIRITAEQMDAVLSVLRGESREAFTTRQAVAVTVDKDGKALSGPTCADDRGCPHPGWCQKVELVCPLRKALSENDQEKPPDPKAEG